MSSDNERGSDQGLERLRPASAFEKFALEATPRVFDWVRWSLSLAVVAYAADVAKNLWLDLLFQCGLCLLAVYYFVYFRKLMYERGGILKSSPAANALLSTIAAAVLGGATYITVLKLLSAASALKGAS